MLWLTYSGSSSITFAKDKNAAQVASGRLPPIAGLLVTMQWGRVHTNAANNTFDFGNLKTILDEIGNNGLKAGLLISDKEWLYSPFDPAKYDPCVPADWDSHSSEGGMNPPWGGPGANGAPLTSDEHLGNYRYATKNSSVRKFIAQRWNATVKAKWKQFWDTAGGNSSAGGHPAVSFVMLPESAPLPGSATTLTEKYGYPGRTAYGDYIVEMGNHARAKVPPGKRVLYNLNWIPTNNVGVHADITDRLNNDGVGLWLQDIVGNGHLPSYEVYVYPNASKFPQCRRFANITGETMTSFRSDADAALAVAKDLGVGDLAFLLHSPPYEVYIDAAMATYSGDGYAFMPD